MSDPDLFMQMVSACDALRRGNPYAGREDMKLLFREVQLTTMPELTREQWLALFEQWLTHHFARLQTRLDVSMKELWATIDQ